MPQNNITRHALLWAPLALAAAVLAGCAAPASDRPTSDSSTISPPPGDDAAPAGDDIDALLDIERMGVAVLSDQWVNNDCSVDLALSPDDIVCADILRGADLTTSYEDLGGGLGSLDGESGEAVRAAFEDSRAAGEAWIGAGCADDLSEDCADEGEDLIAALLALDTAFDGWAA